MRVSSFLIISLALLSTPALGQSEWGDAILGQELARSLCNECHLVEKSEVDNPDYPATAFHDIANNTTHTAMSLRVFLKSPHKDMPNFILSEDEIDNVVAYILSLK